MAPLMPRSPGLLLLAALGAGVFVVGAELMVTAVALPQILADLADWTELRRASWIINGYLVAYVAVMPLAGRAADRYPLPLLFGLSLAVFAVGSVLSGAAADLDQLIAARVFQGLGAGAIVPLATAGASHLFEGPARARAIGVIGALTFLGMAAGPFLGAIILQTIRLPDAGLLGPSWRWVFYLGAPIAVLAGLYNWAAAPSWRTLRGSGGLDVLGAVLFTAAVAAGLLGLTVIGDWLLTSALAVVAMAAVLLILALIRFRRADSPFLELHHFRDRTFAGAVLLSLLTGYALATAIVGAAVFVDRVRYGGPDEQQLALGGLAAAMAVGALGSGFILRAMGILLPSVAGLVLAVAGLLLAASARPESEMAVLVAGLALFGFGFGVTVTARSTAAVEALGRRAFGVASAGVTVARMVGMGIGLAALTVFGSNRIEALSVVLVDQQARDAVLPPGLRGRQLEDYLVVEALERWASSEASGILATLFVVAAAVTAIAIVPTLAMRNRPAAEAQWTKHEVGDALDDGPGAGVGV